MISSLPLSPSLLLIILSFHCFQRFSQPFEDPEQIFFEVQRIDRQWREFGLQILLEEGNVLRLMRYQFEDAEYKALNAMLDEGVEKLSICLWDTK